MKTSNPTDKERQLLIWLRIKGGTSTYLSAFHSATTVANCKKKGWIQVSSGKNLYVISLTAIGESVIKFLAYF